MSTDTPTKAREELVEQRDHIIENLEELNRQIRTQNSIKQTFYKGIIYGIGFVIGSTLLAAAALSLFAQFFEDTPIFGDLIERSNIDEKSETE